MVPRGQEDGVRRRIMEEIGGDGMGVAGNWTGVRVGS